MAVEECAPGARAQIPLVATLRWQMFRHSLRSKQGKAEMISRAVSGVTGSGLALLLAAGLGFMAFVAISSGRLGMLSAALWAAFLLWQVLPFFFAASMEHQDASLLLRFPLRYSSFLLLDLAYGLFDPIAAAGVLWILAIAIGILAAKPSLLPTAIPVLIIFAVLNLLLNRVIFSWLDRWLARRHTRELLVVVFMLVLFCAEFLGPFAGRWEKKALPALRELAPAEQVLPPGFAAQAIAAPLRRDGRATASGAAALAVYALALFGLLNLRLRAQYRGEVLTEARAPRPARAPGTAQMAWKLGSISGPVSAVFEKELRYLARNGRMLLGAAAPLALVAYFGFSTGGNTHSHLATRSPDLLFPLGLVFVAMTQVYAYNSLGFDGAGVQMFLAAPVTFRQVFAGKNLAQGVVSAIQAILVWILVGVLFGFPQWIVVFAVLPALLFALLVEFSAGNLFSIYFPSPVQFGSFRSRGASRTAALATIPIQIVILGLPAAIFLLTRSHDELWLAALIFAALAATAIEAYARTLDRCSKIGLERQEALCKALCR